MAYSFSSTGLKYRVRSISLPSRLQPADYCKADIEKNKLKTWGKLAISTVAFVSSETIQTGLVGIAELCNFVQDLLDSPSVRQSLLRHQNRPLMEEAFEASDGLLDFCNTVKESLLGLNEQLQDLQSALRRKGKDSSVYNHIRAYLAIRKKVKKEAIKSLKSIKKMENDLKSSPKVEDNQLLVLINLVREVAATTISVFRSLFKYLSTPDSDSKFGGWSLISKLVVTRSTTSGKDQKTINELEFVDISLRSLHENIHSSESKLHLQMLQKRLEGLETNIQALETGVDCVYRQLIKSRVSFLNVLTS